MKKSDKQAYKQAVKAIDFEQVFIDLFALEILDDTWNKHMIKQVVKAAAKEAVAGVALNGDQHCIIDNYPFKAVAWYDSGDIYCEIIIYICKASGNNKQKKTDKCGSGGEDPCCGAASCCSGF